MDSIMGIVSLFMPLLVGALATGASLAGVHISNKHQNSRSLQNSRSAAVSALFAHINRAERDMRNIKLCLEMNEDLGHSLKGSLKSIQRLSEEYDTSAIYFPDSVSQLIELVMSEAATVNVLLMSENTPQERALKQAASAEKRINLHKKELRQVFQSMIGVKK